MAIPFENTGQRSAAQQPNQPNVGTWRWTAAEQLQQQERFNVSTAVCVCLKFYSL